MKIVSILKWNIRYIWKHWLKCIGIFTGILSVILLFVSWDDIGIKTMHTKIVLLATACLLLLIWAILWTCLIKKQKVIWHNASGRIIVRYGDIIKEGFDTKNKSTKLYVIPVNSAFDTIVDDISISGKPLVSPNSLHGKWINKMVENGKKLEEIDCAICSFLEDRDIQPCKILAPGPKERGKREVYELGTITMVKGPGNNIFLLLALTDFDDNGVAHVTAENLEYIIRRLPDYYEREGQGNELVVPLMGTGLSKAELNHEESLRIITSIFRLYGNKIHGDVSVVIYKGDKDKVSIDAC